jgi:cytochrome o ubiquinol oxidase operon protein cyoD
MTGALAARISGYILSLILTFIAYFIITEPAYFNLTNQTAVVTIFILALLQMVVQLCCFIHVWNEEETYWNLTVFISQASIIFVIIFFSIWIINHLNENMRF